MRLIVLRILTVLNALIGIGMMAAAAWPAADPASEKKPVIVVIYVVWAALFLGLTSVTFRLLPIARAWTIGLYGFASLAVVWGFVSDVITRDKVYVVFPWVSISTYLLFFAFFIWPVIYMLRPGMKEYFDQIQEARLKAEEEAARSSLRR